MPKEVSRGDRQRFARVSNLNPRHTGRNRAGRWLLARGGDRASFDRVLNECVSVRLSPMQTKKERARPYFPRITGHLSNLEGACRQGRRCLHAPLHFDEWPSNRLHTWESVIVRFTVNLVCVSLPP